MSLNKVMLIGHLGKDPELKKTETNQQVKFSLATSKKYKTKTGETKSVTDWHNISIWGKLADVAIKYLKKGSEVYVEGELKTYVTEDKKYFTYVEVNNISLIGGKNDRTNTPEPTESVEAEDDDLPF